MLYPSITVCLVLCIIHTEVLGEDDCEWTNSTTPEYIYIQFPAQANTNYKNNQTCSWQMFSGGKDLAIEMQWTRIDIAISDGCSEDYVQVYNGLNRENGELVDHRCGQSVQIRNIVGRYAFIYFHSNNEDTGKGFEFRYRVVKRVPGIKMKHVSLTAHPYQWQEFTSPYYPMPYYGSDSDRHWLISSEDPREVVHIKFLDFDIEKTLNCSTDSVRIYDGQNENSSLIGKYCGQDFPDVKSTGRKIYISFYADDKGENIGFKAKYLSVKQGSQCSGLTVLKAVRNKKNYLISPDYPHFYSSNLSCSWLITSTAVGRPIYLDVIDSDIEYSQSCMKDYVEIYLGPSRSSPIFSRWCGGTRRKFYTHSSGLLVHFHTDGYFTGRGFQLSYYLIQADSICENPVHVTVLKNVWHTLTSPYYPVVYEGNVTCTWIIEAQNPVHFVELQVDDSEIEESIGCSYDSLSVYDGNQPNSSLIRRWCGTEKPNILSSQSVILIRFHTDVSYEYRGFKFRLRSVDPRSICGPINLIAEKNEVRYLTSPTMAAPHYKSMSCYWLIGATNNDHVVKVSVIVSSFGANNTCKDSYLKAYDGPTEQSELIGNTCGNNTPTYISTGSQMLLTLKSTNPINGFFMSFTGMAKFSTKLRLNKDELFSLESKGVYQCNNIVLKSTREKSYFTSPDFSASLQSTDICTWKVYTPVPGDKIRLELVFTNIESDDNCNDTFVNVYDGINDQGLLLKTFCGRETPSLKSTGSHLFIKLSGHISHTTRFTAVHFSEPKENTCPALKLLRAEKTTQFFNVKPFSFPDDSRTCKWVISSEKENDTILLQFLFINMGDSVGDCQSKYIAVYEGSFDSRKLVRKFCSNEKSTFQTETSLLHVMFYSKHPLVDVSFVAKYELLSVSPDSVNDSLLIAQQEKQYFTSPDFFNQTDVATSINWVVNTNGIEDVIVVELAYSGIPRSYNCREASLRVYDNSSDIQSDNLIGQFCGPETVSVVSSSNQLFIWYSANWSAHSRGFMAVYYSKVKDSKTHQKPPNHSSIVCLLLIVAVIGCFIYVIHWYWQCCQRKRINKLQNWRANRQNYHKFDNDSNSGEE